MSAKARDGQGRWRCKTIGVRISPEEKAELDALVALSGMTKQEYCISRMLERDVVVTGNPRVHKALKNRWSGSVRNLKGCAMQMKSMQRHCTYWNIWQKSMRA